MVQTFFEVERVRTRNLWLFFLCVLLFYILAVLLISSVVIAGIALFNLQLYLMFIHPHFVSILLLTFPFALLLSILHIFFSLSTGPKRLLSRLQAYEPEEGDLYHQKYKNTVEEMAIAMGERRLKALVFNSSSINAVSIKGWDGMAYLVVSEGAISLLSKNQLQALVAQGIARCATGEAFLTTVACSIASAFQSIDAKLPNWHPSSKEYGTFSEKFFSEKDDFRLGIYLIVLSLAIKISYGLYSILYSFLSRENGFLADATAVRLTRDPLALAEVLHIGTHTWRGYAPDLWLSPLYTLPLGGHLSKKLSYDPYHPPTEKRIQILLKMAHESEQTLEQALNRFFRVPRFYRKKSPTPLSDFPKIYVQHSGQWLGPFLAHQITALPFLTPKTLVRIDGQDQIYSLGDLPLLPTTLRGDEEATKVPFFLRKKKKKKKAKVPVFIRCPDCQVPLGYSEKSGRKILVCFHCRGTFLSRQDVKRILVRWELGYPIAILEKVAELPSASERKQYLEENKERRPCPQCGQIMQTSFYSLGMSVVVDKCLTCDAIWFDEDELEMLQLLSQIYEYNKGNPWGKTLEIVNHQKGATTIGPRDAARKEGLRRKRMKQLLR